MGVFPGRGVSMCPPVSVCHQVSTMKQSPLPTCVWYQCQASGLMGSPTVPSTRSEERSNCSKTSSPNFMSALMAVGAV